MWASPSKLLWRVGTTDGSTLPIQILPCLRMSGTDRWWRSPGAPYPQMRKWSKWRPFWIGLRTTRRKMKWMALESWGALLVGESSRSRSGSILRMSTRVPRIQLGESPEPRKMSVLNERVSSLFQGDVKVGDAVFPSGYHLGNPPDQVCSLCRTLLFVVFRVSLTRPPVYWLVQAVCKAFESDPPLPEDELQAEAGDEPTIPPSLLERKGKEAALGVPNKKSKPSVQTGDDLKIGREDNPPPTTSRRPTQFWPRL